MRPIVVTLILAQILGLGTIRLGVALTGEQLLQTCEGLLRDVRRTQDGRVVVPKDGITCWNYMDAIQDVSTIGDAALRPLIGFCAPEDSTLMQYIRIFVDHARRNPAQLHNNGAWIAHVALSRAFLCR